MFSFCVIETIPNIETVLHEYRNQVFPICAMILQLTGAANRDFKCLIADTIAATSHKSD